MSGPKHIHLASHRFLNFCAMFCTLDIMVNPLSPIAPYLIILLRLMPDDFTRQGGTAGAQWVNVRFLICTRIMSGYPGGYPGYPSDPVSIDIYDNNY